MKERPRGVYVRLYHTELLLLPRETRRRIMRESVDIAVKNGAYGCVAEPEQVEGEC
jgi:hypothetical protein